MKTVLNACIFTSRAVNLIKGLAMCYKLVLLCEKLTTICDPLSENLTCLHVSRISFYDCLQGKRNGFNIIQSSTRRHEQQVGFLYVHRH